MRILVLDANQRSALAVTRSLGKIPHVCVITSDHTANALAGSSRFTHKYVQSPAPNTAPEQFVAWLRATAIREQIDWVFPITEITSQLLLMRLKQLTEVKLPFADYDTVMSLANKWQLVQLANRLGVPCPHSELIPANADLTDAAKRRFPLVLKPLLSRLWTGTDWLETSVRIADSAEELYQLHRDISYLRDYPFMLQEFIPGHGAGVFALYDHGMPVAFFAHQRLREKPPRGGVSVLSESAPLDPQLLTMTKALLNAARWHGVAMVEFRIAANGKPYLMEVNTRFWGSLQLAIDAGVDFPALLLKVSNGETIPPLPPYRVGQRLRWLLGDLDNLYLTLRDPDFSLAHKLGRFAAFWTPHPFKTRHEINRLGDLRPAWFELKQYLQAWRGN